MHLFWSKQWHMFGTLFDISSKNPFQFFGRSFLWLIFELLNDQCLIEEGLIFGFRFTQQWWWLNFDWQGNFCEGADGTLHIDWATLRIYKNLCGRETKSNSICGPCKSILLSIFVNHYNLGFISKGCKKML